MTHRRDDKPANAPDRKIALTQPQNNYAPVAHAAGATRAAVRARHGALALGEAGVLTGAEARDLRR